MAIISRHHSLMWILFYIHAATSNFPCIPRHFGAANIVCVCNATYCDTLDARTAAVPTGKYLQYTSNKEGLRFEKSIGSLGQPSQIKGVHLTIALNATFQTMFGFGAAFTDAAGINIKSLSPGAQDNLIKSYFSPEGIELNFGRVPIAGCDFSTHTYTYDDVPNDTRLEHFNLTSEDNEYKIPIIKRAILMSEREIYLLGAAWSAPPWMKTNNDYSGFGFLKEEHYQAWANYHIKFLDAYKKEGLEFWGISTGNEPMNGIVPVNRFNSMGWTPITQFKYVRENLGPTLRNSLHNKTKILALDDQRFLLPWWLDSLKTDYQTSKFIDGIAVHWYWDTLLPASLLDRTHNNFPNKFILGTEACVGDKPWDLQKVILGSWERGVLYMEDIIQDLKHWVVGWIDWNLCLNKIGGPNWANNFVDAAVIVDPTKDEFYKQPMYYALGHFAKFVTEGSVRIGINPPTGNQLQTIAFRTPQKEIVIVIHNKKMSQVPITITDPVKGVISLILSPESFHTIIY